MEPYIVHNLSTYQHLLTNLKCKFHLIYCFRLITFVRNNPDTNMNFRIQQFLAAENISQAQFADTIGVARASVSHIIAGRNKPGFDFIQNMSRHYPELNLEWLINGKGRMYKDGTPDPEPAAPSAEEGQLFSASDENPLEEDAETEIKTATYVEKPKVIHQQNGRRIVRIVVFYDDNSYQELKEA